MCAGVMAGGSGRRASEPAAAAADVDTDADVAADVDADVDVAADVAGSDDGDKDGRASTMRQGTSSRSIESDSAFMSSGISGMHSCAPSSRK